VAAPVLHDILQQLGDAAGNAGRSRPRLLAVSKKQPATAVADLAAAGQLEFGENYVQEARRKASELRLPQVRWHMIGHVQSRKAETVADLFDFVQQVARHQHRHTVLARQRPHQLSHADHAHRVQAVHGLVQPSAHILQEPFWPAPQDHPRLHPLLKVALCGRPTPDAARIERFPLAARAQHKVDPVHAWAVRHPWCAHRQTDLKSLADREGGRTTTLLWHPFRF